MKPEDIARGKSEHAQQTAVMAWAALNVGTYPELKYLFAIPNGGARDAVTGARLRAEGVKRGVPDLCLPVRRNAWAGLWIEMKTISGGRVAPEQADWHQFLKSQGYAVMVAKGYEEAIAALVLYLDPW